MKIKFVEKCSVYSGDVIRLRDNELCAAISYQSIQKHLFEGHIHFSFLIKKNCKESLNVGSLPESKKCDAVKPKPACYTMPNKGSMKANNTLKGKSIPDVKLSGGGVLPKEPITVPVEEAKKQPPDYSSINKVHDQKQSCSPAYCTEAMKRNDDELVGTNLSFILKRRKRL